MIAIHLTSFMNVPMYQVLPIVEVSSAIVKKFVSTRSFQSSKHEEEQEKAEENTFLKTDRHCLSIFCLLSCCCFKMK